MARTQRSPGPSPSTTAQGLGSSSGSGSSSSSKVEKPPFRRPRPLFPSRRLADCGKSVSRRRDPCAPNVRDQAGASRGSASKGHVLSSRHVDHGDDGARRIQGDRRNEHSPRGVSTESRTANVRDKDDSGGGARWRNSPEAHGRNDTRFGSVGQRLQLELVEWVKDRRETSDDNVCGGLPRGSRFTAISTRDESWPGKVGGSATNRWRRPPEADMLLV